MMDGGFAELLLAAFGLYLVIEGAALALFPIGVKHVMALALQLPAATLRRIGVMAATAGVLIVWLLRG